MYTIGQVAKFLGVSRDTLKFYEEMGLVTPVHNPDNGYRQFDDFDIYDVLTTNFYRQIDLEIKRIQEIKKSKSVEGVETLLLEKEEKLQTEIFAKQLLLKRIQEMKKACVRIRDQLGVFSIQEMKPLMVRGEIADPKAYEEYGVIQETADELKTAVTLKDLRRIIYFNEEGIYDNRFVLVKEVENEESGSGSEIFSHKKCVHTIIEDGRYRTGGANIDAQVSDMLRSFADKENIGFIGLAYVHMLLATYEDNLERVFLEIFVPIR